MSNRERTESGEFSETVSHADILDVFKTVSGPAITSTDVVEALGCSDETARRKLEELQDMGVVERRKPGRTAIWWIVEDRDDEIHSVDPDDPIFSDRPAFESGRTDLSESVDEILYGGGA